MSCHHSFLITSEQVTIKVIPFYWFVSISHRYPERNLTQAHWQLAVFHRLHVTIWQPSQCSRCSWVNHLRCSHVSPVTCDHLTTIPQPSHPISVLAALGFTICTVRIAHIIFPWHRHVSNQGALIHLLTHSLFHSLTLEWGIAYKLNHSDKSTEYPVFSGRFILIYNKHILLQNSSCTQI